MAAIPLISADFMCMLQSEKEEFILDLSQSSLLEVLDKYVEFKRNNNPRYSLSCLRHNIEVLEFHVPHLRPCQVTDMFYSQFKKFLLDIGDKPSTIKTYFSELRAILSWASKHNCPISETYDSFNVESYDKTKVYMTPSQIITLLSFDIEHCQAISSRKKKRFIRVRDQFVLGCCLGQRYSDLIRVEPNCFDEDCSTFSIVQQKTGNKAVVYLRNFCFDYEVCLSILKKYDFYAPYRHSINSFNDTIHELLKIIGETNNSPVAKSFVSEVKTENKIAGNVVTESRKFYECVSSHTCRRTFITIAVKRKKREASIRTASGHSDPRSFGKYIIESEGDL